MRIISCHIENFGKLSNYDREFTEGCNSIMASNGQGKSTLAAFIRVMFYGFTGEGKRKAVENERKRYEPWQGGVYGGRLTFDDGNGRYTIIRTFGSKSGEDTFELRDESTNLISDAYAENVGEQLFGLSAESYMRTAYIGQNDVVTHTTDGINAMIGGIADNTNDLDSYEKATAMLNDLLNKESPTRATGYLNKLEGDVNTLRFKIKEGSVILDSIHRLEDSMGVRQNKLADINLRRDVLRKKQQELSAYKDKQALKDKWDTLKAEVKTHEEEEAVRRAAFPGRLPDVGDLSDMQEEAGKYAGLNESVNFHKLSEEEQTKLNELGITFASGMPDMNDTSALIRKLREHDKSLAEESGKKTELKMLRNELESAQTMGRTLAATAIVGMVIILASMIGAVASILVLPSNHLRWFGVGISGLLMLAGIILTVSGLKSQKEKSQAASESLEDEIAEIEKDIEDNEQYRRSVMEETKGYLDRYGMPLDPISVADDLRSLHVKADEYNRLKNKKAEYDRTLKLRDECKAEIDDYLAGLGITPLDDYSKQINRLSMDMHSYTEALARTKASRDKLDDFVSKNDTDILDKIGDRITGDNLSLENISDELAVLDESAEEILGHIRDESRQHDELQERLELWEEDKASLNTKEEELIQGKHRYKNIKSASKYLTMAKESITAKYMQPLLTGFSKYYSSVTGGTADNYHIDANTNITIDELGLQRDTSLLSTGYQDLIGFCLRLALIDAMYEGEKPMLILDDPFVNLDMARLEGAKRLIDKLAQNYQMIYFTCR